MGRVMDMGVGHEQAVFAAQGHLMMVLRKWQASLMPCLVCLFFFPMRHENLTGGF